MGREEELDALDEALAVGDRGVITQTITGLGGIGKSQLAARYVQQRADGYDVRMQTPRPARRRRSVVANGQINSA